MPELLANEDFFTNTAKASLEASQTLDLKAISSLNFLGVIPRKLSEAEIKDVIIQSCPIGGDSISVLKREFHGFNDFFYSTIQTYLDKHWKGRSIHEENVEEFKNGMRNEFDAFVFACDMACAYEIGGGRNIVFTWALNLWNEEVKEKMKYTNPPHNAAALKKIKDKLHQAIESENISVENFEETLPNIGKTVLEFEVTDEEFFVKTTEKALATFHASRSKIGPYLPDFVTGASKEFSSAQVRAIIEASCPLKAPYVTSLKKKDDRFNGILKANIENFLNKRWKDQPIHEKNVEEFKYGIRNEFNALVFGYDMASRYKGNKYKAVFNWAPSYWDENEQKISNTDSPDNASNLIKSKSHEEIIKANISEKLSVEDIEKKLKNIGKNVLASAMEEKELKQKPSIEDAKKEYKFTKWSVISGIAFAGSLALLATPFSLPLIVPFACAASFYRTTIYPNSQKDSVCAHALMGVGFFATGAGLLLFFGGAAYAGYRGFCAARDHFGFGEASTLEVTDLSKRKMLEINNPILPPPRQPHGDLHQQGIIRKRVGEPQPGNGL